MSVSVSVPCLVLFCFINKKNGFFLLGSVILAHVFIGGGDFFFYLGLEFDLICCWGVSNYDAWTWVII